jgi:hypothetical protein
MQLAGSLLRVSLLLFVVSLVGLIGINGSVNPAKVSSAQAASLNIVLTSNAQSTLQFQVVGISQNCWQFLAPGDACYANVVVENLDPDWTVELSQPSIIEVSGGLTTCDGGTQNLNVHLENISYAGDPYLLTPLETQTFDVYFELKDVGNPCQGQTGTIVVQVLDGVSPSPTPTATNTPAPTSTASPTPSPTITPTPTGVPGLTVDTNLSGPPVSQIGGAQTGGPGSGTGNPNDNGLISEISPTRLPVTGQGWQPVRQGGISTLDILFLGLGATSIFTFFLAIALRRKENKR